MVFKHFIAAAACAVVMVPAMAESQYLHIRTASGWEVLDLAQVDRLTFKSGSMTATDKQNNTVATYNQNALESMYVDENAGIESVVSTDTEATFTFSKDGYVEMKADGAFLIYGADGALLLEIPEARKGEIISLKTLRQGVVILKSGNYSIKAIVK